jgi:hypothetical protein
LAAAASVGNRPSGRRELRNVPLHQFRANVERSHFYEEPGKQRWAERRLFFQEHHAAFIVVGLTILGAIFVALLTAWLK